MATVWQHLNGKTGLKGDGGEKGRVKYPRYREPVLKTLEVVPNSLLSLPKGTS